MTASMTAHGFAWRRAANWVACELWKQGERGRAYLLFREVIKDAELETPNQETN